MMGEGVGMAGAGDGGFATSGGMQGTPETSNIAAAGTDIDLTSTGTPKQAMPQISVGDSKEKAQANSDDLDRLLNAILAALGAGGLITFGGEHKK